MSSEIRETRKDTKASNANSGENEEVLPPQDQEQGQDEGNFKCEATMRRISALAWSSELRNLPEMNFVQLYNYMYLIFSTQNIGTSFWKEHTIKNWSHISFSSKETLKSWKLNNWKQNLREGECSSLDEEDAIQSRCRVRTYLWCVTQPALAPLGSDCVAKENVIMLEEWSLPWMISEKSSASNKHATALATVWVVPRNPSVTAKPLDKVLIQKIRFGQKTLEQNLKLSSLIQGLPRKVL